MRASAVAREIQRMQVNYPKQYAYCMDKLGIGNVLDYEGIPKEVQPTLFDENITR